MRTSASVIGGAMHAIRHLFLALQRLGSIGFCILHRCTRMRLFGLYHGPSSPRAEARIAAFDFNIGTDFSMGKHNPVSFEKRKLSILSNGKLLPGRENTSGRLV